MNVSLGLFHQTVNNLAARPRLSFDTETTGLRPFNGDHMFCMIFHDGEKPYYFNFQPYLEEGIEGLPRHLIKEMAPIFHRKEHCSLPDLYIHNAKFDMNFMSQENIVIQNTVWCTQTMARVLRNDHMTYSLAACGERIGVCKDNAVEEWIKKHKLWEWVILPGKKKRSKIKYYDRVPFEIMYKYGCQDARVGWQLGEYQRGEIAEISLGTATNKGTLSQVVEMESEGTSVYQDMEREGVPVDRDYCEVGAVYEEGLAVAAKARIEELCGMEYKDSNQVHEKIFSAIGVPFPRTAKNNPSFTDDFLATDAAGEIGKHIREFRSATLRGGTYFRGFQYWADSKGLLHPDMKQAGTATGRFSYGDPNLQNMPKVDKGKYPVRAAIIPPPGYFLCSIDYDQMEFKLMLDYAGQMDLIQKIKEGHDAHTTTAELCGIPRREAKILNFGLLYGMGLDTLAATLGCTREEARDFKAQYFSSLTKVKKFINAATYRAEKNKYVYDWLGRRFYFEDKRFAYKAANAIIQGGCSSIVKMAMNDLHRSLAEYKTHMLLQIHDEILFAVHDSERHLIPEIKKKMEASYPFKSMPMTCSVSESKDNFFAMKEIA